MENLRKKRINPFGVIFRKLRIEYDIHVEQVALYCKVSKAYIYNIERTLHDNLSYRYFLKILDFLKYKNILTEEIEKQFIIAYHITKKSIILPTEFMDNEFIYKLHKEYIKHEN